MDEVAQFVSRPVRDLLVAGADDARRRIKDVVGGGAAHFVEAATAAEALEALRRRRPDAVVLAADLPDVTAADVAERDRPRAAAGRPAGDRLRGTAAAGRRRIDAENARQRPEPATSPPRRSGCWTRRRWCCTAPSAKLEEDRRRTLEELHKTDKALAGKKVLIVDDDIRNIFALTSVLECYHMEIRSAETGREAIRVLQEEEDVDVVLMDIMMPEMDGLDTMKAIRKLPRFKTLPIIAVTAKAMKGDREKCIEAGAWDYLSKPVDTEQMLAVLRGWLHR